MVKLDKYDSILNAALKNIRPSEAEEKQMDGVVNSVVRIAKKHATPMVCGSSVKGTWLSGRNEIDLFLLYSPSLSRKQLEERGMSAAKAIIKELGGTFVIAYAEHPYVRGKATIKGKAFDMDVVPCYDVKDPAKIKSAVDRTPHHVRFVNANLGKKGDEVRLLKQFCKASGCYGADVKTQGFSGYLCELLIIKYGSFMNVVKEASAWHAGVAIDLKKAKTEKFKSPLVVIDPVDPERNVAAAVSSESFYRFVKACSSFLSFPHPKKFVVEKGKPYSPKEIFAEMKARGSRFYAIRFKRPDIVDDTLWPQMRRALARFEGLLAEGGFRVMRSDCFADAKQCLLLFELEIWKVPWFYKHIGPTIYSAVQSNEFLKRYKDSKVYVSGDDWAVESKRKHIVALLFLKEFLSKSLKALEEAGMPSKIAPEIARADVASGADAVKMLGNLPDDFRIFIREYFEKNLNFL